MLGGLVGLPEPHRPSRGQLRGIFAPSQGLAQYTNSRFRDRNIPVGTLSGMLIAVAPRESIGLSWDSTLAEVKAHLERDRLRALGELYRALKPRLFRCLELQGCATQEAEEIIHGSWPTAVSTLERAHPDTRAGCWFLGVARNHFRNDRKRRFRHQEVPAEDDEYAPVQSDDPTENAAKIQLARRALSRLPNDESEVFVLHEVEGCTAPEIGEILGIPLGTVRSRLRRAREGFKRSVEELQRHRHE